MKYLPVLFSLILFTQTMTAFNPFTERELEIIFSGEDSEPFRILQTTDPVDSLILRMESDDIITSDSICRNDTLQYFINRLQATLTESGGAGIAAPQVGILKNIFLFLRIDKPEHPVQVAINPKITNHPVETVVFERDGCLSIPDISANSVRYPWIDVEYMDEKGVLHKEHLEGYSRCDNFTAIIYQHEYDHLNGVLFIDKIPNEVKSQEIID